MVEKSLHTFFLVVFECSTAELIHEEQDCFVPEPEVLLNQNPDPKLQDSCHANSTGKRALHNVILENPNFSLVTALKNKKFSQKFKQGYLLW